MGASALTLREGEKQKFWVLPQLQYPVLFPLNHWGPPPKPWGRRELDMSLTAAEFSHWNKLSEQEGQDHLKARYENGWYFFPFPSTEAICIQRRALNLIPSPTWVSPTAWSYSKVFFLYRPSIMPLLQDQVEGAEKAGRIKHKASLVTGKMGKGKNKWIKTACEM